MSTASALWVPGIMGDILIALGIVVIANSVPLMIAIVLASILIYHIVRAWRSKR
jgi:hypothetical protein